MTFQTKRSLNGWKCFLYVDFRESVFFEKVMRSSPENVRGRQKFASACPEQLSGDYSAVAPPVPIPNTEVKRCSPDGSASIGCARVGRRQNLRPAAWKQGAGLFFPDKTPRPRPGPPRLKALLFRVWFRQLGCRRRAWTRARFGRQEIRTILFKLLNPKLRDEKSSAL